MYKDVFIVIWVENECCKMFKQPTNCTLEETSHCVTDTVFKMDKKQCNFIINFYS